MPSPTKSTSSGGPFAASVKQKKVERKAKEQLAQTLQALSDKVGKLEDRDTQQQAFQALVSSVPQLSSSLASELYNIIERNKVGCHPQQCAKLLPRITAYIGTRLRDNETAVTEACGILVSSVTLHVFPRCGPAACSTREAKENSDSIESGETWRRVFETVSTPLTKDASAIGENATRCLCALLRPTEFDGQSLPSPENTLAHATRVQTYFSATVSSSVAKMNGSTMYASFSPGFLLLKSACEEARHAYERVSVSGLLEAIAPLVGFIVEAIEDAFQYGPREDWVLRKRGMELLTLLIESFGLSEDEFAVSAAEYFRVHLDRVRDLVLSGRQDPVSSVREAANQTVVAFDKLNRRHGGSSPAKGTPLPIQHASSTTFSSFRTPDYRSSSRKHQYDDAVAPPLVPVPTRHTTDSDAGAAGGDEESLGGLEFGDSMVMDDAAAPEQPRDEHRSASQEKLPLQTLAALASPLKQFVAKKCKQASERRMRPQRIASARAPPDAKAFPEFEFAGYDADGDMGIAMPEAHEDTSSDAKDQVDGAPLAAAFGDAVADDDSEREEESDELEAMSRADAALRAAECGERELAFRLCLLEDDAALLTQVMGVIGMPCMHELSRASRSALCAAFLELLDGGGDENARRRAGSHRHDKWLVFAWLRDLSMRRASVVQIDPRVLRALEQRLQALSEGDSRAGLEAASVLALLDL